MLNALFAKWKTQVTNVILYAMLKEVVTNEIFFGRVSTGTLLLLLVTVMLVEKKAYIMYVLSSYKKKQMTGPMV